MTYISLPTSPAPDAPMPPDAIARALEDLAALSDEIQREHPLGMLEPPPLTASVWRNTINTRLSGGYDWAIMGSSERTITWRWGVLEDSGDWYQVGWHPTYQISGLRKERASALYAALNKRHRR